MKTILRIVGISMLALVILIIPGDSPAKNGPGSLKMSNPAYDYCAGIMGYDYQVITHADGGQTGMCKLPDETTCSDWDFYAGKCGAEYSWCEQNGYNLVTRRDGKDPYSPEYAVCVDQKARDVGPVSSLSGLNNLASNAIQYFEPSQKEKAPVIPADNPRSLLPASFDWRTFAEQNWTTSVKNQSTCGSCWAFSTVALTEAQLNIIARNPNLDPDLSEQYLISDCFGPGNCFAGIDTAALEYISENGIPDEACYPYRNADSLCSGRCADYASRLRFLPNTNSSANYSNDDIKYILSKYGPLTINFWMGAGNSNEPHGSFDGSGIYRCTNEIATDGSRSKNHSVLVVGYNDAGGYWIAKNSYGASWNGDGFFKLGYNECNVDYGVINWTESSLPITIDKFNYLPMILIPTVPPGAFGKINPGNGASMSPPEVTLEWGVSAGATSYDLCFEYTLQADGICTDWFTLGSTNSHFHMYLTSPDIIFEWQVRATNSTGAITYADNGTVWSFTVAPNP